jgi:hypothetical protein
LCLAKDDAKGGFNVVYTLQRYISILYTLASLSSDKSVTNSIFMHVCKLEVEQIEHTRRGIYHYQVGFCVAYLNLNKGA